MASGIDTVPKNRKYGRNAVPMATRGGGDAGQRCSAQLHGAPGRPE